jgi:hypothetical protein
VVGTTTAIKNGTVLFGGRSYDRQFASDDKSIKQEQDGEQQNTSTYHDASICSLIVEGNAL